MTQFARLRRKMALPRTVPKFISPFLIVINQQIVREDDGRAQK